MHHLTLVQLLVLCTSYCTCQYIQPCQVPNLANINFRFRYDNKTTVQPGTIVYPGQSIEIYCTTGSMAFDNGRTRTICSDIGWYPRIAELMTIRCKSIVRSYTTQNFILATEPDGTTNSIAQYFVDHKNLTFASVRWQPGDNATIAEIGRRVDTNMNWQEPLEICECLNCVMYCLTSIFFKFKFKLFIIII